MPVVFDSHFSPLNVTKTSSDNTACHGSINQRLKARFTCTHVRTLVGNTQLLDLPVYCVLCATETRSLGLVKFPGAFYTLSDECLTLKWVQMYISEFSCDPKKVTM